MSSSAVHTQQSLFGASPSTNTTIDYHHHHQQDANDVNPLLNNNNNREGDNNNGEQSISTTSACFSALRNCFCGPRLCIPFKRNFSFITALLLIAINLLFFLSLSVLLVMTGVDVLITLIVQCAIPPDYSFAFGGAALICVIFPWVAIWCATVSDYTRWPTKYFLLHYHFRIVTGLATPMPLQLNDSVVRTGYLGQQAARAVSSSEDRNDVIRRSYTQIFIHFIPFCIWFISLVIGLLVGRQHEYGTIFFLVAGFTFVLFITCFEYDVAPTAPIDTSILTWRPADASGMRHILLHHRKFDLSILGVVASLATSCVVYLKDSDALKSGLDGFLLSIVTLALALFVLVGLRLLVNLSADDDEQKENQSLNSGGGSSANLSDQHNNNNNSSSSPLIPGNSSFGVKPNYSSHHQSDAESMASEIGGRGRSGDDYNNDDEEKLDEEGNPIIGGLCDKLKRVFSRKFLIEHKDFTILASEILVTLAATTVLQVDSVEETWPVWLLFIAMTVSTIALWFMNDRLKDVRTKQAMINARPLPTSAVMRKKAQADQFVANLDEENQLVYLYRSPQKPPSAVFRVAYFTVGFVAAIIVFVSFFSAHRVTEAENKFTSSNDIPPTTTSAPSNTNNNNSSSFMKNYKQYPICATKFPGDFSIVDIAALSAVTHMSNKQTQLDIFFPSNNSSSSASNSGGNNILNERTNFFEVPNKLVPKSFIALDYYFVRFQNRNTTVIASSSSFTGFEALQTLYLLSDAVSLEFSIMLVPLPFADRLLSAMIRVASLFKFGTRNLPNFLESQVKAIHKSHPEDDILLIGFDVGGFVSAIAAARLNDDRVTSVSISPLNAGFQTKKYDFDVMNGDRHCASVSAQDDVLNKFDLSMGMSQKIQGYEECDLTNSFCHDGRLMLNSLSISCLDSLERKSRLLSG